MTMGLTFKSQQESLFMEIQYSISFSPGFFEKIAFTQNEDILYRGEWRKILQIKKNV